MKSKLIGMLGIEIPIIQAPMAGSADWELALAVSAAGGLGSIPCAMLTSGQVRTAVENFRQRSARPFNLNFFCHSSPADDTASQQAWKDRLRIYYEELQVDPAAAPTSPGRAPFDEAMCELVLEVKPPVVSFHFGLPLEPLWSRVKSSGAVVLCSATTVEEARYLEHAGCDAIIAQGFEAGGHRGMFLAADPAQQVGTMALVPQMVDAVGVPVIASGGIGDARGVVAAFALGASAVQLGTAYLRCPEAKPHRLHRRALEAAGEDRTALTNVFTGRPARGLVNRLMREVGPISDCAPPFPLAANAVAPLRAKSESNESPDFVPLWAGQAAALARPIPAGALTRQLHEEARQVLAAMQVA